jgi:hypothetical protein
MWDAEGSANMHRKTLEETASKKLNKLFASKEILHACNQLPPE